MSKRLILKLPVIKGFEIIYPFWEDASNEDNERKTAYLLFDSHHPGVDFGMPENNKVYASFSGIVVRREWHKGMGNVIGIRNGNVVALYAHLNKFLVKLGEKVKSKQIIALSGNTGKATNPQWPHLHFELRDITKASLKEMVFKPNFDKPIKCFKDNFKYIVNNENTKKSLKFLSLRYFGSYKYWRKIQSVNLKLLLKSTEIIPDKTTVIIPNY